MGASRRGGRGGRGGIIFSRLNSNVNHMGQKTQILDMICLGGYRQLAIHTDGRRGEIRNDVPTINTLLGPGGLRLVIDPSGQVREAGLNEVVFTI